MARRTRPGSNKTIPLSGDLYASAVAMSRSGSPYRQYGWAGVIRDTRQVYWHCQHPGHPRFAAINCAANSARRLSRGDPATMRSFASGLRKPPRSELDRVTRRHSILGLGSTEWTELINSHNGCCFYCGDRVSRLHREHRVPLSRGGADTAENIVPSCAECNLAKGTLTDEEFTFLLVRLGYQPRLSADALQAERTVRQSARRENRRVKRRQLWDRLRWRRVRGNR